MVSLLAHFSYLENLPVWIVGVYGMRLYVVQVYALQLNIEQVESCLTLNYYTI